MQPYNKYLTKFARNLRSNSTEAEQKLWWRLRRKQLLGAQFYRQKPIVGYIADFYCAAANLVIEVDGSQHYDQKNMKYDEERDKAMAALDLLVLRFDNRQVLLEIDSVVAMIFDVLERRIKK